jgi:hydroxyacylglutathione hydrolase
MHKDDAGMAERGDMFWNRESGNTLIKMLAPVLFRFGKSKRFEADLFVDDGYTFSEYGFDASVPIIPGHSKGSIGIMTTNGDLFCGDLFDNTDNPMLNSIIDDPESAKTSVEKLRGFVVNTVYPGHGKPFSMEGFIRTFISAN